MPTYEYKCTQCSHDFEVFQSMSDEPVKICPECGAEVKKVFTPAGVIFKGSGFYVNDYKGKENATQQTSSAPSQACCAGCSGCAHENN